VDVEQPPAEPYEYQSIRIPLGTEALTLTNVYIPPSSSCPNDFTPSITQFLQTPCSLVLGDINAHDTLWCSPLQDQRGEMLADEIGMSNFGVLNTDTPTRLPTSGQPTSPDVSLASADLLTSATWTTSTTLSSDHLPITLTLKNSPDTLPAPKRTFVNFNRADWTTFKTDTETAFAEAEEQPDALQGEKLFRKIVGKAAAKNIPSGRRPNSTPGLPPEASKLMKERDALRSTDPTSQRLTSLNCSIRDILRKSRTARWHEFVETFDHRTKPQKLWKTIRTIDGKKPDPPNPSIDFNDKPYTSPSDQTRLFNRYLTAPTRHMSSRENPGCALHPSPGLYQPAVNPTNRNVSKDTKQITYTNYLICYKEVNWRKQSISLYTYTCLNCLYNGPVDELSILCQ
jgi:hypothetical protein